MPSTSTPPPAEMRQDGPISDDRTAPGASPRDVERARDSAHIAQVRAGDPDAFGQLYDRWFDRVFDLVLRIVHDRDTAAEVAQDTFLAAWRNLDGLVDTASFGGWVLRIARNTALNRIDRDGRSSAVDHEGLEMIERQGGSPSSAPVGFGIEARVAGIDDPAQAAGDAEVVALVREAAAALGERDAEVLDLQLRYQLTPAEIGQVLDLNRNAANQLCHRVRNRFAGAFGARLLWHGGRPDCPTLRSELEAAGITRFGADAVRTTNRHLEACATCSEDRRTRLSPAALFGAVSVVPAVLSMRTRVAHHLATAGVPMHGSAALPASPAGPGVTTPDGTSPADPSASPAPTQPMPVPSPQESSVEHADGSAGGHRRRNVALLAAAAAIVLLVGSFLLLRHRSGTDVSVAADGGAPTTSSTSSGSPTSSEPATTAEPPSTIAGNGPVGPGGTVAPIVPPTDPGTAGDPTTTVPPPAVEQLDLSPSTSVPSTYALATAPVLTWSVANATQVTIWRWFDDGVSGDRRVQVEATGRSGSITICPGSRPTPDACSAASGHYSFELIAVGLDGSTFTAPTRPGFDVRPPVIN